MRRALTSFAPLGSTELYEGKYDLTNVSYGVPSIAKPALAIFRSAPASPEPSFSAETIAAATAARVPPIQ